MPNKTPDTDHRHNNPGRPKLQVEERKVCKGHRFREREWMWIITNRKYIEEVARI
jgi:hypothetical protein